MLRVWPESKWFACAAVYPRVHTARQVRLANWAWPISCRESAKGQSGPAGLQRKASVRPLSILPAGPLLHNGMVVVFFFSFFLHSSLFVLKFWAAELTPGLLLQPPLWRQPSEGRPLIFLTPWRVLAAVSADVSLAEAQVSRRSWHAAANEINGMPWRARRAPKRFLPIWNAVSRPTPVRWTRSGLKAIDLHCRLWVSCILRGTLMTVMIFLFFFNLQKSYYCQFAYITGICQVHNGSVRN